MASRPQLQRQYSREYYREYFLAADANHDGYLSFQELFDILKRAGYKENEAKLKVRGLTLLFH